MGHGTVLVGRAVGCGLDGRLWMVAKTNRIRGKVKKEKQRTGETEMSSEERGCSR